MVGAQAENRDQWWLALKIHELAEPGSSEFRSAELLCDILESNGFSVSRAYFGIPTAFRAEFCAGSGQPAIAFLAEYDALPGMGHACGHNLIASASVFSAIGAARRIRNGRIIVIGTPDEEGSGAYSGSKAILAERGAFRDVDLVLGSHPGDEWDVGKGSLAVQDIEIVFHGRAAHESAAPDSGRSALDAAILSFTGVNMLRQHVRRDANVVIHGILKEGGTAPNVTPDRAVMLYGLRSSDTGYLQSVINRFRYVIEGAAHATETTFEFKLRGPLFTTTKVNIPLAARIREHIMDKGHQVMDIEHALREQPGGSTDFANVSRTVPAIEVEYQIAPKGTPWHSLQSLEAARSTQARAALGEIIEILTETAVEFTVDGDFRQEVRLNFSNPA
jgi:amidohydrolase